jgi:hypothetical protein
MNKFGEYVANAAICRQKAEVSALEDDKRQWLRLAQFWQGLIQTPDRHASNPGGEPPEDGGKQCDRFVRRHPIQNASASEAPFDGLGICQAQSRAARLPSVSKSGIRRTIYWSGGKPVSLAYIPALADEHPEATSY